MSDDVTKGLLDEIEAADEALARALDRRAKASRDLVRAQEHDPDVFVRHAGVEDIVARLQGQLEAFPASGLAPVLREVLSACRSLAADLEVAYRGAPGSFAHLAARMHFGHAAVFTPLDDGESVLDAVTRGRHAFGVLPLETSTDGAVTATLVGLASSDARICAESTIDCTYHLLSQTGNAPDVEKVYGTRAALGNCQQFLTREFPRATLMDVPSGELAAELARGDHGASVVGTEMLQDLFGLRIITRDVGDERGVRTRYAVVGTDLPSRSGHDRTVIAMAVQDSPGALYSALQPFASRDINLTKLESRPTKKWRYLFFTEMDGHVTDRPILTALEEVRSISPFVKVLGSYPV